MIDLGGQFAPDGKRRKEFFQTEREANERALEIKNSLDLKGQLPKGATPELIQTALHYDQLYSACRGVQGIGAVLDADGIAHARLSGGLLKIDDASRPTTFSEHSLIIHGTGG